MCKLFTSESYSQNLRTWRTFRLKLVLWLGLSMSPPSARRVWPVLLPLPQPGPRDTVPGLQAPHLPVCHLPRSCTRLLQLLLELRSWWSHRPHDGLVPPTGWVPRWLWMPLPPAEHFLKQPARAYLEPCTLEPLPLPPTEARMLNWGFHSASEQQQQQHKSHWCLTSNSFFLIKWEMSDTQTQ